MSPNAHLAAAMDAWLRENRVSGDAAPDVRRHWASKIKEDLWPGEKSEYTTEFGAPEHWEKHVRREIRSGRKPPVTRVLHPERVKATQDYLGNGPWSENYHNDEPPYRGASKAPVLMRTPDDSLHVMDGHHRIAHSVATNKPVHAYVFRAPRD